MNLYVIGPVTGKPNENREEFEHVDPYCGGCGAKVVVE